MKNYFENLIIKEVNNRKGKCIIMIHIFIFCFVFYIFYPPMYTIYDEANYLGMAFVLKQGTIFPDKAGMMFTSLLFYNDHLISLYPIGTSLLMVPFIVAGWNYAFLLNFILHILSFFIFIKILIYFELSPYYSLLFLYYPPYNLYMRTLMSDIPSVFFAITAFYAFLRKGNWLILSGALFGYSLLIRYSNLIIFISAILMIFYSAIKLISQNNIKNRIHDFSIFAIGFLPLLLVSFFYNYYVFKNPFLTGYHLIDVNKTFFKLGYFPRNVIFYLALLCTMYPLMIVSTVIIRNKNKILFNVFFWPTLIFYCFYSYTPDFGSGIQYIVVGLRFMLPVLFIPLLTYIMIIEQYTLKRKIILRIFFMLINLAVVPYIVLSYRHYQYQKNWFEFKNFIYSNTTENSYIICDEEIPKLIQNFWGKRIYIPYIYITEKLHVENKINYLLKKNNDVYLAQILRPYRDIRNLYSIRYSNEILDKYKIEKSDSFISHAGKLNIYKILAKANQRRSHAN